MLLRVGTLECLWFLFSISPAQLPLLGFSLHRLPSLLSPRLHRSEAEGSAEAKGAFHFFASAEPRRKKRRRERRRSQCEEADAKNQRFKGTGSAEAKETRRSKKKLHD
uniref:Uncharacterized protein n=1 Tax=Pediastrum duplex TaxID=3105 RepID=A0A1W5RNR4_PEDDU|nr:hypothetical protein [Pediastrum duplex]AQU64466.1 hypothetical protein [Pediastrum duplex]